jgi:beta-lactamase regulating signal transducer with metallopeptidase domain
LTLFWLIYSLFLESETYHRLKRAYLHLGYMLSLILPFFTFTKIEEINFTASSIIPISSEFATTEISSTRMELFWSFMTENSVIELIYMSISLLFIAFLLIKFYKLLKVLNRSKAFKKEGFIHVNQSIPEGAFSFLNYIVYDPNLYSEEEMKLILAHEKAHVFYKHSFDILLSHIYNSFFWFNPFAWLYQKSLVLNLEYEADAKAVSETAKTDYQMTLYKITEQNFKTQLQHSFHQSPIKKRIAMLNKNNQQQSLWKLFIVSPLLVVFFLLFQVETKAQVTPSITTTEAKVNKIEVTYDANTTIDEIESDISFLKEDFDIDMTFSEAKFGVNGNLVSISLAVETNYGFSGSVSSSDVASRPVYFFRDFSEGAEVPFGVGTRSKTEMVSKMNYETIKNAENFIINGKKIDKEELVGNYIPVETSSYNDKSKTLSVTTKSEFSQPYFSDISDLLKELKTASANRVIDEFIYIRLTSEYKVTMMKISDFKVPDNVGNASKNDDSQKRKKFNDENIVYLLNDEKIDESQMTSIDPKEIDSINVVKSKEDLEAEGYNSNFVEGLIKITSKKWSAENASQIKNSYDEFRSSLNKDESVIYIVDGKEVDKKKISEINHNEIASVFILKSVEAIEEAGYDPKKVDGLIKITTKKEVKEE